MPSAHDEWLAARSPKAELQLSQDNGHISVLNGPEAALGWLREQAHRTECG